MSIPIDNPLVAYTDEQLSYELAKRAMVRSRKASAETSSMAESSISAGLDDALQAELDHPPASILGKE
jgi:hypothetical protein